ncbi:OB-fold putative lipoprotein [Fulvivirga sedimenti]|uniref:OB-fold putative lipoprotein n=1 Tax=Fulvivirga sedimenti TaxID=2879465 RepID=A0A9X1HP44_9BACT|nr:OB-fold putative lipoprotein [Fulvivirga sedimenti]MCA6074552.1 OB-fold putative lipoprotein [Fulvivirga sedimenti]MCA6075729.1 OB-fold putative lipoprotein [Fulvivirga sedimenti]MCA6076857.1 OB-fold putative lipoprotein [Fulvivirga sedimenti]
MQRKNVYLAVLGMAILLLVLTILWPDQEKVEYELTASELAEEFSQDETSAMEKFSGKRLAVSGLVDSYNPESGVVLLKSNNQLLISCALVISELPKSIEINEMITVEGVCTGMLLDVQLSKCILR